MNKNKIIKEITLRKNLFSCKKNNYKNINYNNKIYKLKESDIIYKNINHNNKIYKLKESDIIYNKKI